MRKGKFFRHFPFLLILIIYTLFLNGATSEVYVVGDGDEWNSQANFLSWSTKYNFTVGDILVFKYVKGQHNVYEVEEDTFRSCDSSSGVLEKYESGNDQVKLTEAKKYWFICDVSGHCLGGMRFGIDVKQANPSSDNTGSNDGSPTSQPTELPATPPSSSGRGTLLSENRKTGIYTLAFGMLFKLFC
ncbi:Cupredoxin [Parasponia andersonii]|uniref:Cupredoxin n=1 Tax=Parasponia andersonii TaxID=3476 RepID=A0A2P5B8K9_PARAD|nr:Cupredoxin [Parasponia andersonii]